MDELELLLRWAGETKESDPDAVWPMGFLSLSDATQAAARDYATRYRECFGLLPAGIHFLPEVDRFVHFAPAESVIRRAKSASDGKQVGAASRRMEPSYYLVDKLGGMVDDWVERRNGQDEPTSEDPDDVWLDVLIKALREHNEQRRQSRRAGPTTQP